MKFKIIKIFLCCLLCYSCSTNKKIEIYISPFGNDGNPGSKEAPFASIEKAQQTIRELKNENRFPRNGVTVYFRKGVYPAHNTIRFTEEDSGQENAHVVYCAYPGEDVCFIGGEIINRFAPLSDDHAKSRIDRRYHDNIVQADMKAHGITSYGRMKATGFGRTFEPSGMELFFNGEPMTLARYPNDGEWMTIASVPQTGDSLVEKGGDGQRFGVPIGRHYGKFMYEENRPANWSKNDDIWLHGYWTWDWADSYVKVNHIDAARKEFVLDPPHGVYGYTQGQRYYATNILEELDSPGEWFLDRDKGILYFWPPTPVNEGSVIVSTQENLMLQLEHTKYMRIEGITFDCSRGDAVKIVGGSHNIVGGCTIRNMGSNGIIIEGGHDNGVTGCDIYNIGDCGIIISGGDRTTLAAADNFAHNNHIHHYSRINKTYRPAIKLDGVGNLIAHNYIHDSPHTGVLFSGNENVLEFNEIHDIAKETGDVGAFYIGRDWTQRGNIVRHNYFHHLHGPGLHGVMAVYLDDAASGTTIYGNVFYQAGRSAFVGGGHDNTVENNIFIECKPSIHLDSRGVGWAKNYIQKDGSWQMYEKLEAVNYNHPPYSVKYPALAKILDWGDPAMPKGNIFRTNLSYGGTWRQVDAGVNEITIENNYILKNVPSYIDVEKGKIYPDNEKILEDLNFRKIPFDHIGLYIDDYRRKLPNHE